VGLLPGGDERRLGSNIRAMATSDKDESESLEDSEETVYMILGAA